MTDEHLRGVVSFGSESTMPSYEEIVRHVPCPTCRGKGKIPKDSTEEYVALIPLSDKRLQPQRTAVKISIAVALCIVIGGLLLFFLFPRSIVISIDDSSIIYPIVSQMDSRKQKAFLSFKSSFNLTNNNYVATRLANVSIEASFRSFILRSELDLSLFTVGMRQKATVPFVMNITFDGDVAKLPLALCVWHETYAHQLTIQFEVIAEALTLGEVMQASVNHRATVDCYPTNGTTQS